MGTTLGVLGCVGTTNLVGDFATMLGGVTGSGTFTFGGSPESGTLEGVTIGGGTRVSGTLGM